MIKSVVVGFLKITIAIWLCVGRFHPFIGLEGP